MRAGEVRAGRQERAWGVVAAHKRHTKGWPDSRLGAKGMRGERTKNMKLMIVTLEVSKLSGWLKADAYCRVEGRACDAGGERSEPGGGRACGAVAAHKRRHARGKARLKAWGPRARAERTKNMLLMSVTLEVSQPELSAEFMPEMSALKLVKSRKRELMSVMAETSQSAMGPYVAVAAVGLALNALTAACREALVVKVPGGEDGGGGN
jgi:hypothetical protein